MAALTVRGEAQVLGQLGPAGKAVQGIEDAEPGAGIGRDLDDAHGLARHHPLAALGQPCRQPQLAGGQEQQPPGDAVAVGGIAAHAGLAALVAQQVGQRLDHMRRRLPDLVQGQERVAGTARQPSAALSVVRQLDSGTPQTERAACSVTVLPIEDGPKKWNPPNSSPAR